MSIEHNVVEIGGLEYKAVKGGGCIQCALNRVDCKEFNCISDDRADHESNVIAKRHYSAKLVALALREM